MVVLGGVSILGGAGSITGVVIAAFIMGLVTFGMGLLNVPGIVQVDRHWSALDRRHRFAHRGRQSEGDAQMSERYAFRMRLNPACGPNTGSATTRSGPSWSILLHRAGVSDYDIWLDEETNLLFGILTRTADHAMDQLPLDPIMQRWWAMMADIMESRPDNSPVDAPLTRLFHMD